MCKTCEMAKPHNYNATGIAQVCMITCMLIWQSNRIISLHFFLLLWGVFCLLLPGFCYVQGAEDQDIQLLFTGDILLSRNVQEELAIKQISPWQPFQSLFAKADWVVGNLEGAFGLPEDCASMEVRNPCFAIPENSVALLQQAGFKALSLANNHSADLGMNGVRASRRLLSQAGIMPLTYAESPSFFHVDNVTIGLVAISMIPGKDGQRVTIPDVVLRQKLRLARQLANLVVVVIHWGYELQDWQSPQQQVHTRWLIQHGADLIIGHHPHVIQAPACVMGKPVFYSLGNHVFDQKYPITKTGLLADCRIKEGKLTCHALLTQTPYGSSYPVLQEGGNEFDNLLAACPVPLSPALTVSGYQLKPHWSDGEDSSGKIFLEGLQVGKVVWKTPPIHLLSIESGKLGNGSPEEFVLTLERHYSPLDQEPGVRPYVYHVTDYGLLAKWRGSALAWPLIDARLLEHQDGVLCALHRGDNFLILQPETRNTRVMAYQWNGFGFSGLEDPSVLEQCQNYFIE